MKIEIFKAENGYAVNMTKATEKGPIQASFVFLSSAEALEFVKNNLIDVNEDAPR